MVAQIPNPADFDVSVENGFLPTQPPLDSLPNEYYKPWEDIVQNLQGLILSKRLRGVVNKLPVLSTAYLRNAQEWRRAYSILGFITHAYIWGGNKPAERIPAPITIPFLETCEHLELPPVATYAGLVLWNWKPMFESERTDTLSNLDMLQTFTGSMDEKWFYLVSVAIEARGAPLIPMMLEAIAAARRGDKTTVLDSLRNFAERIDELGLLLTKMYDNCDPHVFYNRIRPYLAGSKNMADAGLPNGVVFDNGGPINKQRYVQFSGGSNAQSSIIQFFDLVLNVEHRPTGQKKGDEPLSLSSKRAPPPSFIHEMRKYMPGPHARFLAEVGKVANLRAFVEEHSYDSALTVAFDASLAMLSALRDKHIQIVSRYIIIQSAAAKKRAEADGSGKDKKGSGEKKIDLAHRPKSAEKDGSKKSLKGTGGSTLIPFLRQARDETGEPAVDAWARRLLSKEKGPAGIELSRIERRASREAAQCPGLATVWPAGMSEGGICIT
jgi:indoleamine 2,3-dioxygenase